eukprot:m51a1_g8212 hypothetical protein (997) ;mRNA; r:65730-71382
MEAYGAPPTSAPSPAPAPAEVASLNAQIALLEEELDRAHSALASASKRERDVVMAAAASIHSIFSAVPVRCAALESGRLAIRESLLPPACPPSPTQEPQQIQQIQPQIPGANLQGDATAGQQQQRRLSASGPPSPSPKRVSPAFRFTVTTRGASAMALVSIEIRFKRAFHERPPRVAAWILRPGTHVVERVAPESVVPSLASFELRIEHADPRSLAGAVVNWIAYATSASNPAMVGVAQAIMTTPTASPAAFAELKKVVRKFVAGASLHEVDGNGQTLLHVASYTGNTLMVKWLISKGANVNAVDEHGWTPLFCATSSGNLETALAIVTAGADCKIRSESDSTALHYLCKLQLHQPQQQLDRIRLMQALVRDGVDVNYCNSDGDTALAILISRNPNDADALDLLLRSGAVVATVNASGESPLHVAVRSGNARLVEKLVASGADPYAETEIGTPASLATSDEMLTALTRKTSKPLSMRAYYNVEVLEARGVVLEPAAAAGAAADLYCVVRSGRQEHRTKVAYRTLAPEWQAEFLFLDDSNHLTVELWQSQMAKSGGIVGSMVVSLDEARNEVVDRWFTIAKHGSADAVGQVHLRLSPMGHSDDASGDAVHTTLRNMIKALAAARDDFSQVVFPREEWISLPAPAWNTGVAPAVYANEEYHVEATAGSVTHHEPWPQDFDDNASLLHYKAMFHSSEHTTVCGLDAQKLPVVASVQDATPGGTRRVIVRTKKDDRRYVAPSSKSDVAAVRAVVPALSDVKLASSRSRAKAELLLKFEAVYTVRKHKFGVLYAAPGQRSERELLRNVEGSEDFEDFLDFLGETVTLRGWSKFAAGLDTKGDCTGTQSVYTTLGEGEAQLEVMFHVATMLPYQQEDPQMVERKRHIGNDIVVLIFKESSGPDDGVDVTTFVSHFNHVFLVVTPDRTQGFLQYRLAVVCKAAVRPFSPFLSENARFYKDSVFRTFLLKKLINAERAAVEAPSFRGSLMNSRKTFLTNVIETP